MKRNRTENKTLLASLGFIVGIFSLFFIFHPSISSHFFSLQRQYDWNQFSKDVIQQQKIQGQDYWKFREFYSVGNFMFREKGFSESDTANIIREIGIPIPPSALTLSFLSYHSDHFVSLDSLVNESSISGVLDQNILESHETILDTDQAKIYKTDLNTVKIIFIKPLSDMQEANGFFDYSKIDSNTFEEKYWINISSISL